MLTQPPAQLEAPVSLELSKVLEAIVKDAGRAQPVTLRDVRTVLSERGLQWSAQGELEYPQDRTSLLIELDSLIGEYGDRASADGFIMARASQDLSRFIEMSMAAAGPDDAATLGAVRDAIAEQLVGEGGIEADQDAALLIEIDALIARYGAAAPAQVFVR